MGSVLNFVKNDAFITKTGKEASRIFCGKLTL